MGKKKKLKKSIESLQKQIEIHKEKIKQYSGPKEFLIDYWQKQIDEFEKQKKKRETKLEKE